ncbi:putative methyltransferase DDB_G0268948 [Haliotis asinina]|uniref:putative methyltransferase DDB_G0268948 n=1 Tax=Haliotis asinina TaxID=109174 RepID=UPI0035320683
MSQRFFECGRHAEIYVKARPRYSEEVFDLIFRYCQTRGGKFKLAVDVACGTGHQSTLPLVERFEKVMGLDVSKEQLKQAPKNVANMEFKQSTAEMLCCDPNSVDFACGLHWFNIPEFFSEVERVLSPGGCLAVYCYGWVSLQQSAAQDILQRFITSKLCDYHNNGTRMCTDWYKDVELPFQETQSLLEVYRGSAIDENPRFTAVFTATILLGRKPL